MSGTASSAKIDRLLGAMLSSGCESLQTLVSHDVKATPVSTTLIEPDELLGLIGSDHAVARGNLDRDFADQMVRVVLSAGNATALAGFMMMSPDDVVEERFKTGTLEGEELETYSEVANVLYSSFDSVLRERVTGDIVVRALDHGLVKPGFDGDSLLGTSTLVAFAFTFEVATLGESTGWILLELKTADIWNEGPIVAEEDDDPAAQEGTAATEDDIPAAPIQGNLTAYVTDAEILGELRLSCRRVGLELDRRARTEVPNPAEHRQGIVLMDVPAGDTRRFEWCKRLKAYNPEVQVVLMIHHPSRSRVLQGFLAKADVITGWPIDEPELSQKLAPLLESVAT